MYLVKTPKFIQSLFPNLTWNLPNADKVIYLTFDDGPIPEITPWVLELLAEFEAKATFFCVGNNVKKYPEVFEQVISQGHTVGNHTQNHLSGWASDHIPYVNDVRECSKQFGSNLFRPPYGRMKPTQVQFLQKHYDIIMWDVLSGDFDQNLDPSQCLGNVLMKTGAGSIVVFHDSIKAERNLKFALPRFLAYFTNLGYRFESINQMGINRVAQAG